MIVLWQIMLREEIEEQVDDLRKDNSFVITPMSRGDAKDEIEQRVLQLFFFIFIETSFIQKTHHLS